MFPVPAGRGPRCGCTSPRTWPACTGMRRRKREQGCLQPTVTPHTAAPHLTGSFQWKCHFPALQPWDVLHGAQLHMQAADKSEDTNKQTKKENNYPHAHQPPGCVYAEAFKITKRSQQQDHVINYLFKLNSILIPIYCGQEIFLNFS